MTTYALNTPVWTYDEPTVWGSFWNGVQGIVNSVLDYKMFKYTHPQNTFQVPSTGQLPQAQASGKTDYTFLALIGIAFLGLVLIVSRR